MSIKQKGNHSKQIEARMEEFRRKLQWKIRDGLISLGDRATNIARSSGNYKDRTGNLRSSIGYSIGYNGAVVHSSNFTPVLEGSSGSTKGRELSESLISSKGWSLVFVAGEQYALFVENMEGYQVLSRGMLYLRNEFPIFVNSLKEVK